jgi:hypothetical protein
MNVKLASQATIAGTLAILLIPPSAASARRYMLKHPNREHCKAHYAKKIEKLKKREQGKTVILKETLCVYVAPKKTSATPSPITTKPTPIANSTTPAEPPLVTRTTLTVGFQGVGVYESCRMFGYIPLYDECYMTVQAKVTTSNGAVVTSPAVVFDFTNPSRPGKVWTFSDLDTLYLEEFQETTDGSRTTELRAASSAERSPDGTYVVIGETSGFEHWQIAATYPGSAEYPASESAHYVLY